jgi:hypothetical protein
MWALQEACLPAETTPPSPRFESKKGGGQKKREKRRNEGSEGKSMRQTHMFRIEKEALNSKEPTDGKVELSLSQS